MVNATVKRLAACSAVVFWSAAAPVFSQDRPGVVFGEVGGANMGHHDSEYGSAPIAGGGAAFHLTPRFLLEADLHGGRLRHVFGRDHHNFDQVTMTISLLFRTAVDRKVHFVAGAGLGVQRAETGFDHPSAGHVRNVESLNLKHGRIGADWDVSNRLVIRTDAAMWIGGGLDWILGGRVGVGYRF
jgi:hypothetical protein